MAQFSYEAYEAQQSKNTQSGQGVSYFALKNDGDEAIIRFAYSSPKDFDLMSVHVMNIDGRMRRVNCLRTPFEPLQKCPLCARGEKVYQKFFVKLIEYVRDESGNIVPMPRVWERPASFAKTLNEYFNDFGDISDCIFKVKRHGAKGSTETRYDIIFGNPGIYKPEIYVKDFSGFNGYSLTRYVVLDKTAEEINALLGGVPMQANPNTIVTNPGYVAAPATPVVGQVAQPSGVYEGYTPDVGVSQLYADQPQGTTSVNQQAVQNQPVNAGYPTYTPQTPQTPTRTPGAPMQQGGVNPTTDRPRRYTY